MPEVTLNINKTPYKLACGAGEEELLMELGSIFDERIAELTAQVGQVGDTKLILLAALNLLNEARSENDALGEVAEQTTTGIAALSAAAQKIDRIAQSLESA